MAMYSTALSTTCKHIRMHHVNSIHTHSMLASGTHAPRQQHSHLLHFSIRYYASHQRPSLLLICFCCQQVKTNKQDVSPGGDGNPVHLDINFDTGTPTRGACAHSGGTLFNFLQNVSRKERSSEKCLCMCMCSSVASAQTAWSSYRRHTAELELCITSH